MSACVRVCLSVCVCLRARACVCVLCVCMCACVRACFFACVRVWGGGVAGCISNSATIFVFKNKILKAL